MSRRIISLALMALIAIPLMAFDLVVPAPGDGSYMLLDGDEEFIVDDTVYFKRAFDSRILAERFTDHITSLSWGDDEGLIVLMNASEAEIEGCMYSLYMVGDEPDMLIVDSPLDIDMLKRLDVDEVYHVGDMSGSTRAMLRRSGIDFMELDGGDIIRFEDGKTRVITGDGPAHDGVFVTCPTCGTVIYVPMP